MKSQVKKSKRTPITIDQMKQVALSDQQQKEIKGGDGQSTDGIIVQDVIIH